MVFHLNDFTDSEPEDDSAAPSIRGDPSSDQVMGDGYSTPPAASSSPPPVAQSSATNTPAAAGPSVPHHSLKITLRPNLHHLVNDPPSQPISRSEKSERSSLSPPPPITLKLSRQALVEKATYSSSEDDDYKPGHYPKKSPKKAKQTHHKPSSSKSTSNNHSSTALSNEKKESVAQGSGSITGEGSSAGKVPAQHRKTYDWLTPSTASASHHGPPDRKGSIKSESSVISKSEHRSSTKTKSVVDKEEGMEEVVKSDNGMDVEMGGENEMGLIPNNPPTKKKSHKRRGPDAPPGPGKNWRKGIKKGMPMPWREGDPLPSGAASSPNLRATPSRDRAGSQDSIQEPPADRPNDPILVPTTVVEPNVPFIKAETEKLGFPVYSKPIAQPKITLGTFPRVTQFFAPINGGDVGKFPRKEKVREWKATQKILLGVGGGALKFNSWQRGPPSELGRLIQADKETKEAENKAKKAAATAAAQSIANSEKASTTPQPLFSDGALMERPSLTQANSFESTAPTMQLEEKEDEQSEVGDDNESVSGSVAGSTVNISVPNKNVKKVSASPTSGGNKKKAKAKPRRSKLAHEITVDGGEEDQEMGIAKDEVVAV